MYACTCWTLYCAARMLLCVEVGMEGGGECESAIETKPQVRGGFEREHCPLSIVITS
jgi:hypothetical protein